MSLKDSWKETGVGLGHAFKDLGKTLVKTASEGIKKAEEWANEASESSEKENNKKEQ